LQTAVVDAHTLLVASAVLAGRDVHHTLGFIIAGGLSVIVRSLTILKTFRPSRHDPQGKRAVD
jgi:hypothetical protein